MLDQTITATCREIRLADPARRNALGRAMFDAIEAALRDAADAEAAWERAGRGSDAAPPPLVLGGTGPVFCAGFDLAAAASDPAGPALLMREFIERLGAVLRTIRRHPAPVIAAVHGAALAGGCALVSACDLVVVAADATLGYPVHRIGVSPAVSSPTFAAAVGAGAARSLMLSGELVDGRRAHAIGLATHLVATGAEVLPEARRLAALLAGKGPQAIRATKTWLNELDGCDDAALAWAVQASAALADGDEATEMLGAFWRSRA